MQLILVNKQKEVRRVVSMQVFLFDYLTEEQQQAVRPILRVLKPQAQEKLCAALIDYMEFGVEENLDVTVTPSPETLLMGRERVERLQRLVNSLPEKQSRAFTLFHFDGLETAEIARVMGETESYVRLLLSRARKEVKSRID